MSTRSVTHDLRPIPIGKNTVFNDVPQIPSVKPKSRKIIKRTALIVLALVIASTSFIGWKFYSDASKITGDKNPLSLLGLFSPAKLNETNGRVNILLAGYSIDDPNHQGAALTDSIMVVSYNPTTNNTVMISIPRDMWVDIPGFGYQKINAAYEDGQQENFNQSGYDSGGMGLLEEVIQQDFGISTDYYALVDYTAFKDSVNAVGGVTITINSPDPRGLYDPNTNLQLPNGTVTLNGQQALNLARSRGDGYGSYGFPSSDFNRTQYQQQLLVALKTKASSAGVVANPIKMTQLADSIGNNLKTNMSIGVMYTLYKDSNKPNSTTKNVTLNNYNGTDLLTSYVAYDGEDALIPAAGMDNYNQIQTDIQQLLVN